MKCPFFKMFEWTLETFNLPVANSEETKRLRRFTGTTNLLYFCRYFSPYVELSRIRYSASPASLRLVLLRSSLHSLCDSPRYTRLTSYFFLDSRRLCARSESVSLGRPLQRLRTSFPNSPGWSASMGTSKSARLCAILPTTADVLINSVSGSCSQALPEVLLQA